MIKLWNIIIIIKYYKLHELQTILGANVNTGEAKPPSYACGNMIWL